MKKQFLVLSVMMSSLVSQAYEYNCQLVSAEGALITEFVFDVSSEANKFVSVERGLEIGCLQFASEQPLLTCLIGNEKDYQTVTTDLGVSIVATSQVHKGEKISLTCLKHN